MRIVCAWCNTVIGGRGSVLSHGICRRCFADLFQPQFGFMTSVPPDTSRPASTLSRRGGARRLVTRGTAEADPCLQLFG